MLNRYACFADHPEAGGGAFSLCPGHHNRFFYGTPVIPLLLLLQPLILAFMWRLEQRHLLVKNQKSENTMPHRKPQILSLSLSLSHTHTHTHTHALFVSAGKDLPGISALTDK